MPETKNGTVSDWIRAVKDSTDRSEVEAAVDALWDRYFDPLVRLARSRLRRSGRGHAGEEDVALSAIKSFYNLAVQKRYKRLECRDDLWRILATIAARKAGRLTRRRPMLAIDESAAAGLADSRAGADFVRSLTVEAEDFLRLLPDDTFRRIALMRLHGYTNREIADGIGCCVKTVEYKLTHIRKTWLPLVSG
jgi:DNA-directed RNA polymerase specialized sigma24 family protein